MTKWILLLTTMWACQSTPSPTEPVAAPPQEVQISGSYKVIFMAQGESTYRTIFENPNTGERLLLRTYQKPIGLKKDQLYDLRALVGRKSKNLAEITQALVFFDTPQGRTPVHMLSVDQKALSISKDIITTNYPGFLIL